MGVGHVHEYPAAAFLEAEALRVTIKRKIGDFAVARGIDNRQRPLAVADEDVAAV